MSEKLIIGLVILIGYLLSGTFLAAYYKRRLGRGEKDFYIASGRLGGFLSSMTYAATTYSSFMIVGLVGFAYATGVGSLGFELVYFVGTLMFLLVFSRKVWRMAKEKGWITPADMLSDLFGSKTIGIIASIVYLFALIPYASAQLRGIGVAVEGLGGEEYFFKVGVIIGMFVLLAWSLIAGMWSVAITDALQGLWMLLSALLFLGWLLNYTSSNGLAINSLGTILQKHGIAGIGEFWSTPIFLAFTIPWFFFAVTNPQVVQRLFVPKDEKSLSTMIKYFALFGIFYTVLVTLIGLISRAATEEGVLELNISNRDQVTPALLSLSNPILSAIVFTSIVAASVSTADSILLTLASTTSRNIFWKLKEQTRLRIGYLFAAIITIFMGAIALANVGYIVKLSVLSSLLLLSFAPPTIAGWLGLKPNRFLVAISIIIGPLLMFIEAVRNNMNYLLAFSSKPMGVPIAIWILVLSSILLLIKKE